MSGVAEPRDDETSFANEKGREAKILEFRIGLSKSELDTLKRKKSTECNIEIVGRKTAYTKGDVNNLVDRLR